MVSTYSMSELDWGTKLVKANLAWNISRGYGVKVAVLDTGCESTHPELAGRIYKGKDFTNSKTGWNDVYNHGTGTAGIIAANEDTKGAVGIAPLSRLLIGKVHSGGGLAVQWLVDGLNWAIDEGVDVINLSIDLGTRPFDNVYKVIKTAVAKNIIVVCAAGNHGPGNNTVHYPAAHPESIAVGAVGEVWPTTKPSSYYVPDFSSRGPEIDIMAPGVVVRVLTIGKDISYRSGTSFAAPYVSGAAALYVGTCKRRGRQPTVLEFKKLLRSSSKNINNVSNVLDCSALVQSIPS